MNKKTRLIQEANKRLLNESLPPEKHYNLSSMELYIALDKAYKAETEEEFTKVIDDIMHDGKRPQAPNVPKGAYL